MDEFAVRLVVVAGVASAATAVAAVSRSARTRRRRAFRPVGLAPGLHLFSSEGCPTCGRVRSVLRDSHYTFTEHSFEAGEGLLDANHIERVPTLAWVEQGARTGWLAEGVPTGRTLRRWLGP